MKQIVASDVGATITGIKAADLLAFTHELIWAAAKGQLHTDKIMVAFRAVGQEHTASISEMLPEVLW